MRPLQSLTFEAMIDLLSTTFSLVPDTRHADRVNYSLHDTLISGFIHDGFFQSSLLKFQRKMKQRRGRCNLETIFGVDEVPSDTQMREMLDGVSPELLRLVLPALFEKVVERAGPRSFTVPCPAVSIKARTIAPCSMAVTIFTRLPSNVRGVSNAPMPRARCISVTPSSRPRWSKPVRTGCCRSMGKKCATAMARTNKVVDQRRQTSAASARQDHPQMPLIVGGDALYCHEPLVAVACPGSASRAGV